MQWEPFPCTKRPSLAQVRVPGEWCRPGASFVLVDTVLIDQETVYAPRQSNDRLLLGLKGSLNEYELDLLRQRSLSARYEKAKRCELIVGAPIGFVKAGDRLEKNPDRRVQEAKRAFCPPPKSAKLMLVVSPEELPNTTTTPLASTACNAVASDAPPADSRISPHRPSIMLVFAKVAELGSAAGPAVVP